MKENDGMVSAGGRKIGVSKGGRGVSSCVLLWIEAPVVPVFKQKREKVKKNEKGGFGWKGCEN